MPCRSDDYDTRVDDSKELKRLQEKLDETTRLLCELFRGLSESVQQNRFKHISGLKEWWKTHELADFKRQREEERQKLETLKKIESLRIEADQLEAKLKSKK